MIVDLARIHLADLDPVDWARLTSRSAIPDATVLAGAMAIVAEIAERGDEAVLRYSELHGGGRADGSIVVPDGQIEAAVEALDPALHEAILSAIRNVTAVHAPQRPRDHLVEPVDGVTVERVWRPLDSVGVYVPGGRALYPSSLIMGVVPARVAGVGTVVVATPAAPSGEIDPAVLATAGLLEVDALYAVGGAQAIGALAHGTDSIERVNKIVGPGGPWVTAAKLAVFGTCGIDLPAGPSEAAVLADEDADVAIVAADVMCQAEHGEESAILLAVTSEEVAERILTEIDRSLPRLPRAETIRRALDDHGMVVVSPDLAQLADFVDDWAPEHLSVHTHDARHTADAIPNAGSVFVGHWTPEAAGDYATGANHVLPTGGLASAYGPLAVDDFGSHRQVQTLSRAGLETLAPTILELADAEGFSAHANSVTVRLGGGS